MNNEGNVGPDVQKRKGRSKKNSGNILGGGSAQAPAGQTDNILA